MAAATSSVNGYLTSTDWNTFNNKGSGTVTSVAALTLGTTGTDLSSTVANGTTTPVITLNVPTASATNRGALSAADWTTFNGKANAFTYTSNYIPYGQGTTTPTQSVGLQYNGTTFTTTGISTSNNLTFTGTGNRITGDFSNGTETSRTLFQSSTTNGATRLGVLPNGTSAAAQMVFWNNSTASNCGLGAVRVNASDFQIESGIAGAGTYVPITIFTGGSERARVFTSGGVSIGNTTDPGATNLSVNGVIKIGSNQAVNGPAVSAYKSTNQSITTFTPTKITFDTESFDTNSNFASSTFTPTVAGYYQISAGFFPSADSTTFSRAFISIYKNGAEWQRLQDITTIGSFITFLGANGSCLVYCNGSTDYIEAYGFIAGTNPVIGSGSTLTYFDAVMVRGA
jgi:hypothetical protein